MAEEQAVQEQGTAPEIVVTGGPTPDQEPSQETAQAEPASQERNEDEAPSKQPSGKERLNKRFSELTRTIYEERARREAVERELAELRGRAAPAKSGGDGPPKLENFSDYEEYAEAKARWVAAEEIRRVGQENAMRAQREHANRMAAEIRTRWDTSEAAARTKYEDYDEVMANPEVRFSDGMAVALLDSEIGPEMAYYLKAHPEEARKIAELSPVAAARAIGKLEAKLSATPPTRAVTQAPPPPKPVTAAPPDDGLSERLSVDEWIKRRNKQVLDRR